MLDYPTCLKLKENGFPQKSEGDYIDPNGEVIYSGDWHEYNTEDCVSLPTLEELIKECGLSVQDFDLERRFNGMPRWIATLWKDGRYSQGREEGKTPEEAVANLYLALAKSN